MYIIGYTFLHWFLFIYLKVYPIREDIVMIWIPFATCWIPVYIWVYPRLKLLKLINKYGKNVGDLLIMIASIAILIPSCSTQYYIKSATGKLSNLEKMSDIDKQVNTKYYKVKKYFVSKQNIVEHYVFGVTGKYSTDFNMNIYIAMPIFDSSNDVIPSAWFGVRNKETISNRLSDGEKEEKFQGFLLRTRNKFKEFEPNKFEYLEREAQSYDGLSLQDALKKETYYGKGHQHILMPWYEPLENRNKNVIWVILGGFWIPSCLFLLLIAFRKFK